MVPARQCASAGDLQYEQNGGTANLAQSAAEIYFVGVGAVGGWHGAIVGQQLSSVIKRKSSHSKHTLSSV